MDIKKTGGSSVTMPWVEIAKAGGYVQTWYHHESLTRAYLMNASEETLSSEPRAVQEIMKNIDCIVHIIGSSNEAELSDVPSPKFRLYQKASEPRQKIMLSKRWNATLHPTYALAQEARKSGCPIYGT